MLELDAENTFRPIGIKLLFGLLGHLHQFFPGDAVPAIDLAEVVGNASFLEQGRVIVHDQRGIPHRRSVHLSVVHSLGLHRWSELGEFLLAEVFGQRREIPAFRVGGDVRTIGRKYIVFVGLGTHQDFQRLEHIVERKVFRIALDLPGIRLVECLDRSAHSGFLGRAHHQLDGYRSTLLRRRRRSFSFSLGEHRGSCHEHRTTDK